MITLNTKYFQTINTKKHGEFEYTVYKPLGNPMILYSKKDGTALASLHLRCQDNNYQNDQKGNRGKALITKRPKQSSFHCDFQGLIDRDGQEFELVITNLTNKGWINFNILKKNKTIKEVNPGGLNEVNELRPFESYSVQCDQATNCTLVLNAIKKNTGSGTVNVTVGEDESQGSKPTGTYYYLSVVPESGKKDLVELYKETIWACSDVFAIRKKLVQVQYLCNNRLMMTEPLGFNILGNSDVRSMRGMGSIGEINLPDLYDNMEPRRDGLVDPRMSTTGNYESLLYEESCDSDDMDLKEDTRQCMFIPESMLQTKSLGGNSFKNLNQKKLISHDIIKDSMASSVSSGRKITVNSSESNMEYNYEASSVPCVIGLSISPGLVFHADATNLLEIGKTIIEDMISNESKNLLAELTTIYEEDSCVICLEGKEDGLPVDSVFYQCGHKCCHDRCGSKLTKCPLCRKHIGAHIKV